MNKLTSLTTFIIKLSVVLISASILSSCGVYSFTGASISPDIKTISISRFQNNAQLVEPTLSEKLTNAIRDKFTTETNLILLEKGGDLRMEGEIVRYVTTPVAIQANQTAALNRLSITIKVRFTNTKDESMDYESNFTRYEDYPSSQSLSTVQETLINQINEMLVDDLFNKAVVNW